MGTGTCRIAGCPMTPLTDDQYAEAVRLCAAVVDAAESRDGGPTVAGSALARLRALLSTPDVPESGAEDLAGRVARVKWARTPGALPWDSISSGRQEVHAGIATEWLAALRAAGLAVVELPAAGVQHQITGAAYGTGWAVDVPSPDGRGPDCTAQHVPGFHEDAIVLSGELRNAWWGSTADARRDAARILAACDELDRLRAEHSGGDPQ